VLAVVGLGSSLAAARDEAERAADKVTWDGMQRRHDIAARLPAVSTAWDAPEGRS
jgi:phosphoribosylamine-glycine ligase